jgi:hypothetical protein
MRLSPHERIVLIATKRFKPSYAGSDRYQMVRAEAVEGRRWITDHIPGERFITRAEWAIARTALVEKGLLTLIGGITMAGREALGDET